MTNHTKEQVLELAKKHGAIIEEKHVGSPIAVYFDELPKLLAYTAAIEERNLAQIALLRNVLDRIGSGIQWHAENSYDADESDAEMLIDIASALHATQQTADAFLAERDARVEARAMEEAAHACEMVRYSRKMQGNTIGFNAIGDCIDKLQGMAAEKRKQAGQGKET